MNKNNVWILAVSICLFGGFLFFKNKNYTRNFNLPTYQSNQDQDKDGIEDQMDLLLGAKAYVASRPKYKSVYYASGYPDDGYGVCTDVVARAMLTAGYDLKILVNNDILQHPSHYGKDVGDANIDFRRVRNLLVYFTHHAIVLTNDVMDIEAWQAGDIVVFEEHIGVVSDKRNHKGIPYLIHHAYPNQMTYEQDVLERKKVIAHFRIS
ncbi:MAG: DUF1287 domain-containing protein [Erysipelotrichaceae bacterium]